MFLHPLRKWPRKSPWRLSVFHTHFQLLGYYFSSFQAFYGHINLYRSEAGTRYLFAPSKWNRFFGGTIKYGRFNEKKVRGESVRGEKRASNSARHKGRRRKVSKALPENYNLCYLQRKQTENCRVGLHELFKSREHGSGKLFPFKIGINKVGYWTLHLLLKYCYVACARPRILLSKPVRIQ